MNHVFVDFENVHEIDPAVVGNRTVHLTLLLGPKQTRLDAALVAEVDALKRLQAGTAAESILEKEPRIAEIPGNANGLVARTK